MWWILRRARLTGASLFSQATGTNNNNNNKTDSRPQRKDYNQLSSNEKLDNRQTDDVNYIEEPEVDSDESSTDLDERDTRGVCPPCAHDRYNNNIHRHSHDDFSDDTDYDEALTCNVCDRAFSTRRQLSDHQQKKRHFGCSACDSLFPSRMALEHHKEEFAHWSDSGDSDSSDPDPPAEDRHRLL
ncbi:polyribonucleotide nucleotidyltransferase [Aricia agestis]|uniref:polyribonucleotide nucleotidyltransferase n=1 Tax=Aricia agestis TaxID=91739 RepID=UPI001C202DC0|nr:polyribonucleotide nucleotidyltransferase [Aricia agestis]